MKLRHERDRETRRRAGRGERGFTLVETAVAAFLLLIVFFALAQIYARGRLHLGYEEDRRKATAIAQARMDGIRRDYQYDNLPVVDGTDTTFVADGRNYTVSHDVTVGSPEPQATTISITVTWSARVGGGEVDRSLTCTTILGRGMPWPS